jgi:hypothetical protein
MFAGFTVAHHLTKQGPAWTKNGRPLASAWLLALTKHCWFCR